MIDFTLHTHIARPATEVFDYLTDPERLSSWQTNTVSSVPDGPMGVGTRLREIHRGPGGKEFPSVVEVSEYERGAVFGLRVVEGTPVHLRVTLTGATDVSFRVYGELGGLKQLLLQPVLKRQFAKQLATLKSVLEAAQPVAS
jgi:uncharacterized protein YndB with AHSA1/START domain